MRQCEFLRIHPRVRTMVVKSLLRSRSMLIGVVVLVSACDTSTSLLVNGVRRSDCPIPGTADSLFVRAAAFQTRTIMLSYRTSRPINLSAQGLQTSFPTSRLKLKSNERIIELNANTADLAMEPGEEWTVIIENSLSWSYPITVDHSFISLGSEPVRCRTQLTWAP